MYLLPTCAFYEAVEQKLDATVIACFQDVKEDIRDLVDRVNDRFGPAFHSDTRTITPQAEIGWHATPNQLRDEIKKKLKERLNEEISTCAKLRRLLSRTEPVHERYVEINECRC